MYMTDKWEGNEYFSINGFKFIEFYVSNSKQVVHFYRSIFGFLPYAYCGPETGVFSHVSYVLKNNHQYFVIVYPFNALYVPYPYLLSSLEFPT